MRLLNRIHSPTDLKKLSVPMLPTLAREIREFMVESVARTGGHLASSLGAVDLTVALHYVFNSPRDKIIFDVGHQAYAHKMITGRMDQFKTLRQYKGLSGFPKRGESEHDAFGTAHSSTSISAALGMAVADAMNGDHDAWHIAVIGDGALTGGMAVEALNHAGTYKDGIKLLIIVNDNDCSISPSVGALNHHLAKLVSGHAFSSARNFSKRALKPLPRLWNLFKSMEQRTVNFVAPHSTLFSAFDLNYYGPVDGHDIENLVTVLRNIKALDGPMVLHVVTKKGKGYEPAEANPTLYHGVGKFDPEVGITEKKPDPNHPTYTEVFSRWVCDMAEADEKLYAITPAMREGSGLVEFEKRFPDRYRDVAIAEQHAVTYAAGLATSGIKPVVAIYSSFAQRAYDQILHDVAIQNLPVMFAIDRGGLVGADGETHQGVFDIAYLRSIPNMTIMAPSDENECRKMLTTAYKMKTPAAVRYPRGKGPGVAQDDELLTLEVGKACVVRQSQKKNQRVAILAFGLMVSRMREVAETLDATLIDMRFVKPLDRDMIIEAAATHDVLCTIEDGVVAGGAGSGVLEVLSELRIQKPVLVMGIEDRFIPQGTIEELMRENQLDAESVIRRIKEALLIESLVDLKPYNTMAVSATARNFARVKSPEDLALALDWAHRNNLAPFVLGGGSNLLITSDFVDRLVLHMEIEGFDVNEAERTVTVGAGESWHETVKRVIALGWGGPENLALIPGTVGGAIVQNIGAYGSEVSQFVRSVEVYDPQTGSCREIAGEQCDFGYRHSLFKTQEGENLIVLSVTFGFDANWKPNLSYKELASIVAAEGSEPTPKDLFNAVVGIRTRKLPDPKLVPSAGSFFKNPIVSREQFQALLTQFPSIVHYPLAGGREKLAAGWLIEQAGLKGVRDGAAGTYEKQALVLVNHAGQAGGQELLAFAQHIRDEVRAKFGVELEPEPVLLQ